MGTRTLTGRVVDQDGSPIPGVTVNWLSSRSATDRLGVFQLAGLPSKEVLIGLDKKGYRGASAVIPPKALEIEITLPRQPIAVN